MKLSESRRQNKLVIMGALVVLFLAVASIGRVFYLQSRARNANSGRVTYARPLSAKEQAKRFELVKILREKWQPWAKQHKKELSLMLAASKSDTTIRDKVWDLIPAFSDTGKEFRKALNPNGNSTKGESFSWFASHRSFTAEQIKHMPSDEKERFQETNNVLRWTVDYNFREWRDVVISDSVQIGKTSVSLWASGRVTQDDLKDEPQRIPGGAAFVYDRKEILPPYKFINY